MVSEAIIGIILRLVFILKIYAILNENINPKILNSTTGEFIQVNRELTSEDTLYINTQYRNKKVEIERNGVKINAFNYF